MPSLSNAVKAVFFDLGWTLVYPPSGDWEFTEPAKKLFRWDVYVLSLIHISCAMAAWTPFPA